MNLIQASLGAICTGTATRGYLQLPAELFQGTHTALCGFADFAIGYRIAYAYKHKYTPSGSKPVFLHEFAIYSTNENHLQ